MKVTTSQLNAIATLLNTRSKDLVFASAIKTLVDNGVSVEQAINAVLGEGTYRRIADRLHDAFNAS